MTTVERINYTGERREGNRGTNRINERRRRERNHERTDK
jgi:hypothetical protein